MEDQNPSPSTRTRGIIEGGIAGTLLGLAGAWFVPPAVPNLPEWFRSRPTALIVGALAGAALGLLGGAWKGRYGGALLVCAAWILVAFFADLLKVGKGP